MTGFVVKGTEAWSRLRRAERELKRRGRRVISITLAPGEHRPAKAALDLAKLIESHLLGRTRVVRRIGDAPR